jgi:hypothetical protein
MHNAYMNEIATPLEGFKSLLSVMQTGGLRSENQDREIARVKRNIALNETVLRIERDRVISASMP